MKVSKSGNIYRIEGTEKEIAELALDAVAHVRNVNKTSPLESNRNEAKRKMTAYDKLCGLLYNVKHNRM